MLGLLCLALPVITGPDTETSLVSRDGQLHTVIDSSGSFAGFWILLFFFLLEVVFLFIDGTEGVLSMNLVTRPGQPIQTN